MIIEYPTYLYKPFDKYISLKISSGEPIKLTDETVPFINKDIKSFIITEEPKHELINIVVKDISNIPINEFFNVDDIEFYNDSPDEPHLLDIDIGNKKNIYDQQYISSNREKLIEELKTEVSKFIDKVSKSKDSYNKLVDVNRKLVHITTIDQASEFTGEDVKDEIKELNIEKTLLLEQQTILKVEISNIISKIRKLKNVL